MNWLKNNRVNILITLVTVVIGTGAVYASLQLRNASTETEPTESAEVQEVCRTIFTLNFKPTPIPTIELMPTVTIATESASPTISTVSATLAEPFDLVTPPITNTPLPD